MSHELSKLFECYLVYHKRFDDQLYEFLEEEVFKEILAVELSATNRFIRKITKNIFYRNKRKRVIKRFIAINNVDTIINYVDDRFLYFPGLNNMYDLTDCNILATLRNNSNNLVKLNKAIKRQNYIVARADKILVVAQRDKDSVLQYSPKTNDTKIFVVPNGISYLLENKIKNIAKVKKKDKCYVFWGALNFAPNVDAIKWFYTYVYLPYLINSEYVWYIAGNGHHPSIENIDKKHSNIKLIGFVKDLYTFLIDKPTMINPMHMGAGLKNKVLEAMALRMKIISTKIGIEGIPQLNEDTVLIPQSPEEWAFYILSDINFGALDYNFNIIQKHYLWSAINDLLIKVIHN